MKSKKPLIMIVDDEEDIREIVRIVLEDADLSTIAAKDGQDCLDKLPKCSPDLIILDILMPGLTTKKIVTGIRKIRKNVPIIFLTVVRLAEATKKQLISGNMVDYIEKPFDNQDLIKRVKKALKKS